MWNGFKNYLVDTSCSLMFYTPLLGSMEYFWAGMEPEEVLKSRVGSVLFHLTVARLYGVYRHWYAGLWKADMDSSRAKKRFVDTSAMLSFQIPTYSAILYYSGASWKEMAVALPTGLLLGGGTARLYGYLLDKWRKYWGTRRTLD